MDNINYIGANDLIFNTDSENGVYSGGFNVNSIMMKAGLSPIITLNKEHQQGGSNVSDLFQSLVIPNWTLSYGNRMVGGEYKENNHDDDDEIDDDLHDKLLELVKEHNSKIQKNKKKQTKKQNNKKEKKGGTKRKK
jgi:hypothetical protein